MEREAAVTGLACRAHGDELVVELPDAPVGATLAVLPPGGEGRWTRVTMEREVR
jgi:hypothetical protein